MPSPKIFGWSPASDDENDAVADNTQFTFQVRPQPSPPSTPASSPSLTTSSIGVFGQSTSHTPSGTRIPRPRNPFIIYRGEYVRIHHNPQTSKERRRANKAAGRSVSARAADAWAHLSAAEKQRYVRLAELEKQEHARRYPNYQYRPQRRQTGARGSRRTRGRKAADDTAAPPPKRRKRARAPTPESSDAYTESYAASPEDEPEPEFDLPPASPESDLFPPQQPLGAEPTIVVDAATKKDRRRSSSVPVTLGEQGSYLAAMWSGEGVPESNIGSYPYWSEQTQAPTVAQPTRWDLRPTLLQSKRRSRSVTQADLARAGVPLYDPPVFGPGPHLQQTLPATIGASAYSTPFRVQSPRPRQDTLSLGFDRDTPFGGLSPSQPTTPSSLANWNGEAHLQFQSFPHAQTPASSPVAPHPVRLTSAQPAWLPSPTASAFSPESFPWPPPMDTSGHYGYGAMELTPQQQQFEREQDDAVFSTYMSFNALELETPSA